MAVDVKERRRSSVARIFRRNSAQVQPECEAGPSTVERRASLTPSLRILRSKSSRVTDASEEIAEPATFVMTIDKLNSELTQSRGKLGLLFFELPSELCVQILCELHYRDLLALRIVNHAFHRLVHLNEDPIVRYYVESRPEDFTELGLKLYPLSGSDTGPSLDYLFGLIHRKNVAEQTAAVITDFVSNKIYSANHAPDHWKAFQPRCRRMEKKIVPSLFILFHFFETLRRRLVEAEQRLFSSLAVQKAIIQQYDQEALVGVHQVYKILATAFARKFRPPSYAGVIERSIRGWTKSPASDMDKMKLLIFGGLRELKNLLRRPNYNARMRALESFVFEIYTRPKPRHDSPSIMHLSCSVMARLDEESVRKGAALLPSFDERIWMDPALAVLTDKAMITSTTPLQDVYTFLADLMEEEGGAEGVRERSEVRVGDLSEEETDDDE